MIQTRRGLCFEAKTFQVRLSRPVAECDDFQGDDSVETFLPRAKNDALSTPADSFQQFVIAEIHQHRRWRRLDVYSTVGLDCVEAGLEQPGPTGLIRRIGRNCRAAFAAISFSNCDSHPG